MGATPSVQRDAKSPEEAPQDVELSDHQDDEKSLQKNGQISISSLNGKADDQTEAEDHMEENSPSEVGQTDAISPKEDGPETIEVQPEEVAPQVNGEKEHDDSANADEITTEEKAVEEKQEEANEVGFKKIFRFVGFKFTLKKDKNEKAEPVQLLTVKETDGAAPDTAVEEKTEEPAADEVKQKEEDTPEAKTEQADVAVNADESDETNEKTVVDAIEDTEKVSDEEKPEVDCTTLEKEPDPEQPIESVSPPSQETQSPFRRFFTQGIFSNLRKKASFKKPKEEDQGKEKSGEEELKATEETTVEAVENIVEESEADEKEQTEKQTEPAEIRADSTESAAADEHKDEKAEEEAPKTEAVAQTETVETSASETVDVGQAIDAPATEDKPDAPEVPEVTTEVEILTSQEKSKAQGSPLKKLFTGAGLKKLSSKKHKSKKEVDSKPADAGESVAESIQCSTESAEAQKPDSGSSSPEESGEHNVGDVAQAEVAPTVDAEAEPLSSDNEKKKDGILPWSSFKKLVTPKKRVKRSSESEDEVPGDKPKSSTLSSNESAEFEKTEEPKASEEVQSESKEESQVESKAEPKTEKPEPVVEETKKKMDTSVSWEALICVGSGKKRARKTSDSEDEEPKIEEEEAQQSSVEDKAAESPLVSSVEADHENVASSPEPEEELVSTWESFKRLVTHRKKPKAEDKSDEASGPEQTTSDSETPKEESSFSLRKLIPRRKKKSDKKSSDVGSAEDDSDTPAVVPLSDYDNELSDEAKEAVPEENETEETPAVTQVKASVEDRSPSWISTTVENIEDESEGKQLSDIPEEGDTAATPKSTDNTIAEDIVELTSEAVTALEHPEDTEMVSAVSRVTASPVTSGETTPVQTDVVLQEALGTVSITASAMAVTVNKEVENSVAVTADAVLVESAVTEEKKVLVVHQKAEATAICTGLDTVEMEPEESLTSQRSVESVTAVTEAMATVLAVEDKTEKPENAKVTEDEIHEVRVSADQIHEKPQPVENAIDDKAHFEDLKDIPQAEMATHLQEPPAMKVALINYVQQEPETLEEPVLAEQTPQIVTSGPVEPSVEKIICTQSVEVTEVALAKGEEIQELEDVKETVASFEVASTEEVAMAVTEEIVSTLLDVPASQMAGSTEEVIPVVATTEEFAVVKETVPVVSAMSETTESHSAGLSQEVLEKVPRILSGDHNIQVVVSDVEVHHAQGNTDENIDVASTKVNVVVDEVLENLMEEPNTEEADLVTEAEIIQKQSCVIVQEVIQHVVENMAEAQAEQKATAKTVEEEACATTTEVKLQEAPAHPEDLKPDSTHKDHEPTRIVTEKPLATLNEAIMVAETVSVSLTDNIPAELKETATVSQTEETHEIQKTQVQLKEAAQKIQADKDGEEGKTEAQETIEISTVVGASQVVAEQTGQKVQMETALEFNVGVVKIVKAEDVLPQQESRESEDKPQRESQAEVSPQKNQEEDSGCQKIQVATKLGVATEKTANAIAVEEVENEIESISTEIVTVS